MSVPLARRLAGPSFQFNVRFDQQLMTKRREGAPNQIMLNEGRTKLSFVSEYEVFDVKEGEVLVSQRQPGRISDGFCRCFSSVNGWQGREMGDDDDAKKNKIKKNLKFIGIAVTEHKAERIAKIDQGFVAMASGITTIVNSSGKTFHPGMMLTWDVNDKYPVQHGIHARKVGFMLRPAAMDDNGNSTEEVVAKALSYSKKNTTADILLHPMNCCLPTVISKKKSKEDRDDGADGGDDGGDDAPGGADGGDDAAGGGGDGGDAGGKVEEDPFPAE